MTSYITDGLLGILTNQPNSKTDPAFQPFPSSSVVRILHSIAPIGLERHKNWRHTLALNHPEIIIRISLEKVSKVLSRPMKVFKLNFSLSDFWRSKRRYKNLKFHEAPEWGMLEMGKNCEFLLNFC